MDLKKKLKEAKELSEKAKRVLTQEAGAAIEQHWPTVQRAFREKLQQPASVALHDDELMRRVLPLVYETLPLVVRLVVKEEDFVRFCLQNRHRLPLPRADA